MRRALPRYRFSGGSYWSQYTVGGFILYEENPAALLYEDDHFLLIDDTEPLQNVHQLLRTWSFNMNSNIPYPVDIPIFQLFPQDDGWVIDTIRQGGDEYFYCRAARRSGARQEIKMFRTSDLSLQSAIIEISSDVFFGSAPRQIEFSHPRLPVLPSGFVYTGIETIGGSLFASWEEQTDYSIGAAGFVMIKP